MELCVNTKLSYRGGAANVKIYTISESVCNEVSRMIEDMEVVRSLQTIHWRSGHAMTKLRL